MNSQLAEILRSKIEGLPFVDILEGAVRMAVEIVTIEGKPTARYFPVPCAFTDDDCKKDSMKFLLTPGAGKKHIMFFEDGGVTFRELKTGMYHYVSNLKLLCWFDSREFDPQGCTLSSRMVQSIITSLPTNIFNEGEFSGIHIEKISEMKKVPGEIFRSWNFRTANQILVHPYDYFGLDITTHFCIAKGCFQEVTKRTTPAC